MIGIEDLVRRARELSSENRLAFIAVLMVTELETQNAGTLESRITLDELLAAVRSEIREHQARRNGQHP